MRKIDVSSITPIQRPATFGPAPDLRWIDITALRVDPTYQREIAGANIRHIRKIAAAFDWRLFSVVVVSPLPGGVFAIVDGQHRTSAAALCGIESVPCQIIQADAAMQARAFDAINGSTIKVGTQQRFKAACAAGDPASLRIREICQRARITILGGPPSTLQVVPGGCIAVVALQKLFATFDDEQAFVLLSCLRLTVTRPRVLLRREMIEATIDAFKDRPNWFGHDGIKGAWAGIDQERSYEIAREMAAREGGVRIRDMLCAAFLDDIDERLQERAA
ncbi:MAG: ParB N-terminal domain-containing protein [Rhabdaerophilum sp.]